MSSRIVIIGAGSRQFGPATIGDILLSDAICGGGADVVLMDSNADSLPRVASFAQRAAARLGRSIRFSATSDLESSLRDADFVITAIEIKRYFFWAQDFHIPRKYGFSQIYGENGGPGGLFHALRNMGPTLEIAQAMERLCPRAVLLNYTNPLTKLCELLANHAEIKTIGLCHGVYQGMRQVARFLEMDVEDLAAVASGLNHFTWFQSIRDRRSSEDLYPRLREAERNAHWLAEWDEIALSRILFRTYGLYPSPGANHIGEYLGFAGEFLASSALQFFYDRREGHPWDTGDIPTWIYNLEAQPTSTPLYPEAPVDTVSSRRRKPDDDLKASGELAIPIIESLACGIEHDLDAVDVCNSGYVPGLPEDAVVEVPASSDASGLHPATMDPLPEGILAHMRNQVSINKLLAEAFMKRKREPLLQALLLDPTVDSYQRAVDLINEMCDLQRDVLPDLRW